MMLADLYLLLMTLITCTIHFSTGMECYECLTKVEFGERTRLPTEGSPKICTEDIPEENVVKKGTEEHYTFKNADIKIGSETYPAGSTLKLGKDIKTDQDVWTILHVTTGAIKTIPKEDLTIEKVARAGKPIVWKICVTERPHTGVPPPSASILSCEGFAKLSNSKKEKFEVECVSDSRACFKQTGDITENGTFMIQYHIEQRGCFLLSDHPQGVVEECKQEDGQNTQLCVCNLDFYCNNSPVITNKVVIIIFLLICSYILM